MESADNNPQVISVFRWSPQKYNPLKYFHFQLVLLKAFESRDIKKFEFSLEILKSDVNRSFVQCGDLSMFKMVLKTPEMLDFIELCIVHGADLYQVCFVEYS